MPDSGAWPWNEQGQVSARPKVAETAAAAVLGATAVLGGAGAADMAAPQTAPSAKSTIAHEAKTTYDFEGRQIRMETHIAPGELPAGEAVAHEMLSAMLERYTQLKREGTAPFVSPSHQPSPQALQKHMELASLIGDIEKLLEMGLPQTCEFVGGADGLRQAQQPTVEQHALHALADLASPTDLPRFDVMDDALHSIAVGFETVRLPLQDPSVHFDVRDLPRPESALKLGTGLVDLTEGGNVVAHVGDRTQLSPELKGTLNMFRSVDAGEQLRLLELIDFAGVPNGQHENPVGDHVLTMKSLEALHEVSNKHVDLKSLAGGTNKKNATDAAKAVHQGIKAEAEAKRAAAERAAQEKAEREAAELAAKQKAEREAAEAAARERERTQVSPPVDDGHHHPTVTEVAPSTGVSNTGRVYPIQGRAPFKNFDAMRPNPLYNMPGHPDAPMYDYHPAWDFPADLGASVLATEAGTVIDTGWEPDGGNYVWILHPSGKRTGYYHNDSIEVSVGDHVAAGQRIAGAGMTGAKVTGVHVHFWVKDEFGNDMNPELYFG